MKIITTTYRGVMFEVHLSDGEPATWDEPGCLGEIEEIEAIGLADSSTAMDWLCPDYSLLHGRLWEDHGDDIDAELLDLACEFDVDDDFYNHVLDQAE